MESKPNSSRTPAHDWLRPRLSALLADAERAGFSPEAVVATIIDIVTAPPFDEPTASEAPASREPIPEGSTAPDPAELEFDTGLERSIRQRVEQEEGPGFRESYRGSFRPSR